MENLKGIAAQEAGTEAASSLKMFVFFSLATASVFMAVNRWLSIVPLLISLGCLKEYFYKKHVSKTLLLSIEDNELDDDPEDALTGLISVVVDFADDAPPVRITCDPKTPGCMAFLGVIREKVESDKAAFIAEFNDLKESCARIDPIWESSIRDLEIEQLHIPPAEGSLFSTDKQFYADVVFAGEAKHYWQARYGANGFSNFGALG
jgi:hypothetical protein